MSDSMINIFEQNKTIAVIGMSKNVYKAAFSVPMFMLNQGYTIIPINPTTNSIQQMLKIIGIISASSNCTRTCFDAAQKKFKTKLCEIELSIGL